MLSDSSFCWWHYHTIGLQLARWETLRVKQGSCLWWLVRDKDTAPNAPNAPNGRPCLSRETKHFDATKRLASPSSYSITPAAPRPLPSIACLADVSSVPSCLSCRVPSIAPASSHFARLNTWYKTCRISHTSATDLFNCSVVQHCCVSLTPDPQLALQHITVSSSYLDIPGPNSIHTL